jgi:hypothetical protein
MGYYRGVSVAVAKFSLNRIIRITKSARPERVNGYFLNRHPAAIATSISLAVFGFACNKTV